MVNVSGVLRVVLMLDRCFVDLLFESGSRMFQVFAWLLFWIHSNIKLDKVVGHLCYKVVQITGY